MRIPSRDLPLALLSTDLSHPMKIPSYVDTAGLERYQQHERFTVYRTMHQRLLQEDITYHRRWQRYLAAMVCLALVPVLGWIAAVALALRQQRYQNQRIGDALLASH